MKLCFSDRLINSSAKSIAIDMINRLARNNMPQSAWPRYDAIIVSGRESRRKRIKGLRQSSRQARLPRLSPAAPLPAMTALVSSGNLLIIKGKTITMNNNFDDSINNTSNFSSRKWKGGVRLINNASRAMVSHSQMRMTNKYFFTY